MRLVRWILIGIGGLGIFLTVLPLVESNALWIRMWDFPRPQISALLALVLIAAPFALPWRTRAGAWFLTACAAALVWQVWRILPYTLLGGIEAKRALSCEPGDRIHLLSANVYIHNHDVDPLLALVRRTRPDVVLLVETDAWWDRHLAPLMRAYPYVVRYPLPNSYGMHLFSRLELIEPKVRFLIDDYVRSIRTGLRLPGGARIELYGVHPKPPPRHDTTERDAELLIVAEEVRQGSSPAIVVGDLNDVAWSRTNRLFQRVGGLLDPRRGRGFYATFNANWPLLRWPLDHVFFEDAFLLLDIAVMGDIGSDHFPFFASLCYAPAKASVQPAPRPGESDLEEADEAIRKGRARAERDG